MKTLIRYDATYFLKTPRWLVFVGLAVFLASLSIVTARYLDVLIEYALRAEGVENIDFPPPSVHDAYEQFFSNMTQLYTLVVVFVAAAFFTKDFTRQYLAFVFVKPISRLQYAVSKLVVLNSAWFAALVLGSVLFAFQTAAVFPGFHPGRFALATLAFAVFLKLLVAIACFSSFAFKSFLGGALPALVVFFLFTGLSMVESGALRYLPSHLCNLPLRIMAGEASLRPALSAVILSTVLATGLFSMAVTILKRRSLT